MNPQEYLGVLSTRMVHRLSNFVAVSIGNFAIHDAPQTTPEQRAASLAAIREANSRMGNLLDRFSEMTHSLPLEEEICPVPNLITHLFTWTGRHPGWKIQTAPELSTQPRLALAGPWKWLSFALDKIATAETGTLTADATKPLNRSLSLANQTVAGYITLTLSSPGLPIDWHEHREQLKDFELTAAFEILQTLGARPESRSTADGQQTRISLPLIAFD